MRQRIVTDVLVLLFVSCSVGGCRSIHSQASTQTVIQEITSPAPERAFSPRVTTAKDGRVLLSWLESTDDKFGALRFSFWQDGNWTAPATISEGQPFSRHPSESPGVVALSKANLIAYWSQKPPNEKSATDEVDVYFSVSTDGGAHWGAPQVANRPGKGGESSYPSAAAADDSHAALIWLDGTNWKQKRMTLMSRTVQSDGSAVQAVVLDADTCTCCPTSLAQTGAGLLAAYRGHTPENIRDIEVAQNMEGRWSQPRRPHADRWHFAGCPVNGPHLDAVGLRVALIWFSASEDQPKVQLAFSDDGGSSFTSALRVDEGNAIGRAQIALLSGHSALAFWLENKSGVTRLVGRRIRDEERLSAVFEIAHGAGLDYPHVARAGKDIVVTWAVEKPVSRVHVSVLQYE